jgi:hypothetical protein
VTIFLFQVAKSKDLAVPVNKTKPMGIGFNALFAIANVPVAQVSEKKRS